MHICLVLVIRFPRALAERAKVYFYKAVRAPVTGVPLPRTERPGLQPRKEWNLRRQGLVALGTLGEELELRD